MQLATFKGLALLVLVAAFLPGLQAAVTITPPTTTTLWSVENVSFALTSFALPQQVYIEIDDPTQTNRAHSITMSLVVDGTSTPSGNDEAYGGVPGFAIEQNNALHKDRWKLEGAPNDTMGDPYGTGATSTLYHLTLSGSDFAGVPFSFTYNLRIYADVDILTTSFAPATEGIAYNPDGLVSIDADLRGAGGIFVASTVGLPPGLNLSDQGVLAGTPAANSGRVAPYTVLVEIAQVFLNVPRPGFSIDREFSIEIEVGERVLILETLSLDPATESQEYPAIQIEVSGGAAPYVFSDISGLPDGMTLSADGVLSGVPFCGAAERSPWIVAFDISDTFTEPVVLDNLQLVLDVSGPELTLTQTAAFPPLVEGESVDIALADFVAFSGNTGLLEWSIENLPGGLVLIPSGSNGRIMAAPRANTAGSYSCALTLTESDAFGSHGLSVTIPIVVVEPASDIPLTIATIFLPPGTEGRAYARTRIRAFGGSGNYTYEISGLPAGLEASTDGDFCWISGVLGEESRGEYPVQIVVIDTGSVETATTTIVMQVASASEVVTDDGQDIQSASTRAALVGGAAAGCSLSTGKSGRLFLLVFGLGLVAFVSLRASNRTANPIR
ncbi:MAG: hypothetical protein L6Q71_06330 [Planctomycetes bacterium]|nr:hypothetical protein [Planctomycetota bacterium]NUQ34414.1 hypothetical protein [Planctomycetaceae bacterium]